MGESLTERSTRAAQWRLAASIVGAVSQFIVGVLLARLLTPTDFGIAALAYVVLGFAQPLGDLGLGNSVVQSIRLTDRHTRTAFTCSTLFSIAIAAVVAAVAPAAAGVMRDGRVTSILRLLSLGIALRGSGVVAEAILRRNLDFKRQFVIEASSYLVGYGGLAVTLALLGYGVWSLAWGGLIQALLASIGQLVAARHPIQPLIAGRELRDLLRFGLGAAANACVNYVALNGDYFLIGRLMGAFDLGLYTRAYGLMNLPQTYGAGIMSAVMFPAFAQVQGDRERVRAGFLLVTRLTAVIAAPAMAMIVIVAPHLVRGLYGPQWAGAVIPLQVLSLAGYFRALYHLGGVVAQSVGRIYGELLRELGYATAVLGGTWIGSRYGLEGVAVGVSVAILYMFVATGHLALNATGTSWRRYLRIQLPALLTAAATGAAALFVREVLEAWHVSSAWIAVTVLAVASVPWAIGALWTLGDSEFAMVHAQVPAACVRLASALRRSPLT